MSSSSASAAATPPGLKRPIKRLCILLHVKGDKVDRLTQFPPGSTKFLSHEHVLFLPFSDSDSPSSTAPASFFDPNHLASIARHMSIASSIELHCAWKENTPSSKRKDARPSSTEPCTPSSVARERSGPPPAAALDSLFQALIIDTKWQGQVLFGRGLSQDAYFPWIPRLVTDYACTAVIEDTGLSVLHSHGLAIPGSPSLGLFSSVQLQNVVADGQLNLKLHSHAELEIGDSSSHVHGTVPSGISRSSAGPDSSKSNVNASKSTHLSDPSVATFSFLAKAAPFSSITLVLSKPIETVPQFKTHLELLRAIAETPSIRTLSIRDEVATLPDLFHGVLGRSRLALGTPAFPHVTHLTYACLPPTGSGAASSEFPACVSLDPLLPFLRAFPNVTNLALYPHTGTKDFLLDLTLLSEAFPKIQSVEIVSLLNARLWERFEGLREVEGDVAARRKVRRAVEASVQAGRGSISRLRIGGSFLSLPRIRPLCVAPDPAAIPVNRRGAVWLRHSFSLANLQTFNAEFQKNRMTPLPFDLFFASDNAAPAPSYTSLLGAFTADFDVRYRLTDKPEISLWIPEDPFTLKAPTERRFDQSPAGGKATKGSKESPSASPTPTADAPTPPLASAAPFHLPKGAFKKQTSVSAMFPRARLLCYHKKALVYRPALGGVQWTESEAAEPQSEYDKFNACSPGSASASLQGQDGSMSDFSKVTPGISIPVPKNQSVQYNPRPFPLKARGRGFVRGALRQMRRLIFFPFRLAARLPLHLWREICRSMSGEKQVGRSMSLVQRTIGSGSGLVPKAKSRGAVGEAQCQEGLSTMLSFVEIPIRLKLD